MQSRPWPRSPRTIASTCSACWSRRDRRACRPARSPRHSRLAPNTLTFHFDRLRQAGLVTVRRDGRSMIYAARYDTMNALLGFLTENCCRGARARDSASPRASRRARNAPKYQPERSCAMKRMHVHVAVEDLATRDRTSTPRCLLRSPPW